MERLSDLAERFLSASAEKRSGLLKLLCTALREAISAGVDDEIVSAALRSVVLPTLDYTSAQTLLRIFKQFPVRSNAVQKIRLAVLGSFTTKQLVALIELHLFAAGIDVQIYEGDYGIFRQEILDINSQLYNFAPRIILLATSWRDLARRPSLNSDRANTEKTIKAELADWSTLWESMNHRLGCQVIQNNFVQPPWRTFANHEMRQLGSLGRYIANINLSLADTAPPFVTIHDVDYLCATWGRRHWDDARFVHQAKMPCAPEYLVDYAHSLASIIVAQLGLAKKCLVLDLDNTLWGGVVGDDGLGGIRLGQGDPEGEAYLAFQLYVKSLKDRGVILAVCSKNNEETAREAFERHPEMVLKLEDISCFIANWDDKAKNLRLVAERLNIGQNSLVFVDDNPAERAIVRQLVPDVAVPEMPEDITEYIQTVEQHRYFQVLSIGAEDFHRTDYYRADALRRRVEATSGKLDDYLRSLEMVARIIPIESTSLERSVQLINRSNQFNLTTRRRSAAEVLALLKDEAWITLTVSLTDRFGDNGLISVVLAHVCEDKLEIDTWLMSCRVLKRGVESILLNVLCRLASQRQLKAIHGEYIPTPKNGLVRQHYADLGFTQNGHGDNGQTFWQLKLPNDRMPLKTFIQESI